MESGSFVRIRTIQLGYALPSNLLRSVGLRSVRVYANALNPFTFTNYSGFSPEVGGRANEPLSRGVDLDVIPVYRTTTLGLQIDGCPKLIAGHHFSNLGELSNHRIIIHRE